MAKQFDESLYGRANDRRHHVAVIHDIATAASRPFDEVVEYYEEALRELKALASVPDFVPIFVAKKVREIYRNRSNVRREY